MADPLPNLPPEIITDILTRQPVKSLLRFRCVSKPWCSEIDSRSFKKAHLVKSLATGANHHLILGDGRETGFYSIDLDRPDPGRVTDYRLPFALHDFNSSINGLVLVFTTPAALYNPFTGKHYKLPEELPDKTFPGVFTLQQTYSAGYDAEKDEILVLRVSVLRNRRGTWLGSRAMIYSGNTGAWRYTTDFPYPPPTRRVWGVHLNGVLHTATNFVNGVWSIMGFDLRSEKHVTLPKPPITGRDDAFTMEVLGGCLCLVRPRKKNRVDVWIMKEYGVKNSWTLLLSVGPPVIESTFDFCPLVYSKDGQEVLLTHDHRSFTWYHLKKKTVRFLSVGGMPSKFMADTCVATLFHPGPLWARQPRQSETVKPGRSSSSKRTDFLAQGFRFAL